MSLKKGYKGFRWNKDTQTLYCSPNGIINAMHYKVGETYVYGNREIKMCHSGFHFCPNLIDVDKYYKFPFSYNSIDTSSENILKKEWENRLYRFCEVEIPDDGEYIIDNDKIVTNKIKIVREIDSYEEFISTLKYQNNCKNIEKVENVMDSIVLPILEKNPILILGGSLSLMLRNLLPFRKNFDVDLISPYYINIADISEKEIIKKEIVLTLPSPLPLSPFNIDDTIEGEEYCENENKKIWSGSDVDSSILIKDTKVEIFIKPDCKYDYFKYKGKKIKISNPHNVLEAKLKYALNNKGISKRKHISDLKIILNNL